MEYTELNCNLPEGEGHYAELIMAALGELGFESFVETDEGLQAYIKSQAFDTSMLNNASLWPEGANPEYSWQTIEEQNWNAVWESNFEAVTIDKRCRVRAPFHEKDADIEFDILIEPKMSFGTAHHETTAQMMSLLLQTDVVGKTLLDMGCGTAVLAILAAMKGASQITAIDNDDWAYRNALENVERNNFPLINVYQGDASMLKGQKFDIILANINRNILLNDLEQYRDSLTPGGTLMMSGFYTEDVDVITAKAKELGFKKTGQTERNKWATATYAL